MRRNFASLLALCALSSVGSSIARAAADQYVLVVLHSNRPKITLLDSERGRRLKQIKLEREGTDLELAPDGRHVFVANASEARVSVVDLTEKDPERSIQLGGSGEARGIGVYGGQIVVALSGAGQLVLIDPESGDVKKRIETNRRTLNRLTISGSTAYVSDATTGDVAVVDLDRGNLTYTISTGTTAGAFAVDPAQGEVWVADRTQGQLRVLASARAQVVRTVACPGGPTRIVVGGGRVFALCTDSGDIAALRPGAQTIDRRIAIRIEYGGVGQGFDRMVMEPGGKRAFLSGSAERRVLALDLEGLEIRDRYDIDDPVAELLCIKKVDGMGSKTIKREKLKKGDATDGEKAGGDKKEDGDDKDKKDG